MKPTISIALIALGLTFPAPAMAQGATWLLIQTAITAAPALEKIPMVDMEQCETARKLIEASEFMKRGNPGQSHAICLQGMR